MRSPTPALTPEFTRAPAPRRPALAGICAAVAAAVVTMASPVHAERADRTKPMSVTSAGANPDIVDLKKHSAVFVGNVIITQGTLEIHADRVEVSEDPEGARLGYAFGSAEHPATFRQKRDGEDEYSEGEATRIEYDSAGNRVRFVGAAHLRMLKGTTVTDTASAPLITYDTATDTVKFEGAGTPGPGGRTTVVFTPKDVASAPKRADLELPKRASEPSK